MLNVRLFPEVDFLFCIDETLKRNFNWVDFNQHGEAMLAYRNLTMYIGHKVDACVMLVRGMSHNEQRR